MREILPDIYQWAWFSADKGLDFNGHYIVEGSEAFLVDPPPFGEGDEEAISRLGAPGTIVVTNRHHGRRAEECRAKFGARLLVPALDAGFFSTPYDGTYAAGDRLPCGFVAVGVAGSKSPGETALHDPVRKILLLGDALIGKPPGEMSLLPPDKFPDVTKARDGIRALLSLDFTVLLVGDGVSILSEGKEAVRRALAG